jgi:hypothetical protein
MFATTFFSDLTLDHPEFRNQLKGTLHSLLKATGPQQVIVMTGSGGNGKSLLVQAIKRLTTPRWHQLSSNFNSEDISRLSRELNPTSIVILPEFPVGDNGNISRYHLNLLQQLPCSCVVVGNAFDASLNRQPNLIHLEFPATFVPEPRRETERQQNPDLSESLAQSNHLQELREWICA